MSFDSFTSLVTAIATALTALVMFFQYRQVAATSAPHFRALTDPHEADWHLVRLLITPGDTSFELRGISSPNARLLHADQYVEKDGSTHFRLANHDAASSLDFFEIIEPARVSLSVQVLWFFASPKSDRISLKIRSNRPLVRYSIQAQINTNK